jgi:RecA/RadA recombinase
MEYSVAKKNNRRVRRAMTDTRKKEIMMAILIQNQTAFDALSEVMKPEHFDATDLMYAVLWRTVLDYFNTHEQLPDDGELMMTEVQHTIHEHPDSLSDSEIESLNTFLEFAYDADSFKNPISAQEYADYGIAVAKKFLEERIAVRAAETLSENDTVPADVPNVLEEVQTETEAVAVLGAKKMQLAFNGTLTKVGGLPGKFALGNNMEMLGRFMGAVQVPGEIYGILGPYGSCKTTLAVQLVVETARTFQADYKANGGKKKMAFIVSYEARRPELQSRCLGYGAFIKREVIETMDDAEGTVRDHLSSTGNLRSYEKKRFRSKIKRGKKVPGEYERAMRHIRLADDHIGLLDLTGYDDHTRGAGSGGIAEIAQTLNLFMRQYPDRECGMVIIDYVGILVDRYMDANEISEERRRGLIKTAPNRVKKKIADSFNCPVWLMHQLSGDANSRGEGARMHHTDAAECKAFAENLDFAFVLGAQSADGMCTMSNTKHRRAPQKKETVVKIDGGLWRVLDVGDLYRLDPKSRKIMSVDDLERIVDTPDVPEPDEDATIPDPLSSRG